MKLFNKSSHKGFTLIELLVVIAVLGVLAAAVIAAINPVAKINSAKDSTIKSDMSQLVSALQAYYTAQPAPIYPVALSSLVPGELKVLPNQQSGNLGCVTAAGADSTNYCYTGVAGQNVAVWGALFSPTTRSFWCWDSTNAVFKTSITAVAAQTTCP